jgi:hypothetical protein
MLEFKQGDLPVPIAASSSMEIEQALSFIKRNTSHEIKTGELRHTGTVCFRIVVASTACSPYIIDV